MHGGKQTELPMAPAVVGVPMAGGPFAPAPQPLVFNAPALLRSSPSLAALERKFTRDGRKWTVHGPQAVGGGAMMTLMGVVLIVLALTVMSGAGAVTVPLVIGGAVFAVIGVAWLIYAVLMAQTFTFDDGTATLTVTRRWTNASPEVISYQNITHIQVTDKSYTTRGSSGHSSHSRGHFVKRMEYCLSFTDRPDLPIAYGKGNGEDWAEFLAARKSSGHYSPLRIGGPAV